MDDTRPFLTTIAEEDQLFCVAYNRLRRHMKNTIGLH